jgi:protein-tyrosine-phosphatase
MQKKLSLLFVCVGNTCRSAMAEAIAKHRWPHYSIRSAGINVHAQRAAWEAVDVMKMKPWEANLEGHKPTLLDEINVNDFHYIIAMDPSVLRVLGRKGVPDEKIRRLLVDDPLGGDRNGYEECADKSSIGLDQLKLY